MEEGEKSSSSNSLLLAASRHSLYPPVQLFITKSDPKSVTNHKVPAPLPLLHFKARMGGGSLSQKAGNVLLLKLNTVVGISVLVLPSNFRLPFYCDPTGFYSLKQRLPLHLQIAEIILYCSYKSNYIRFDFLNYTFLWTSEG